MPGYTKAELDAQGVELSAFTWCEECQLFWRNRGFKRHATTHRRRAGAAQDGPADDGVPPEVFVIHPGAAQFIDWLAGRIVDNWVKEWRAGMHQELRPEPPPPPEAPRSEVISVDEEVRRYGVSREAIMKRFEEEVVPFRVELRPATKLSHKRKRV